MVFKSVVWPYFLFYMELTSNDRMLRMEYEERYEGSTY